MATRILSVLIIKLSLCFVASGSLLASKIVNQLSPLNAFPASKLQRTLVCMIHSDDVAPLLYPLEEATFYS